MIRVAIKSIRSERNDHMRTDDSQQHGDFSDNLCIVCLVQIAIKIVQECQMRDAKYTARLS